jgi:hypothetical protein
LPVASVFTQLAWLNKRIAYIGTGMIVPRRALKRIRPPISRKESGY